MIQEGLPTTQDSDLGIYSVSFIGMQKARDVESGKPSFRVETKVWEAGQGAPEKVVHKVAKSFKEIPGSCRNQEYAISAKESYR